MFRLRFLLRSVPVMIFVRYVPSSFSLYSVFVLVLFHTLLRLLLISCLLLVYGSVYLTSTFLLCSVSYVPSMVPVLFCLIHSGYVPPLIRLHATVLSLFRVCSAVVLALFWFHLCYVGPVLAVVLPIFRLWFAFMIRLCSDYVSVLYISLYVVLYIILKVILYIILYVIL